MTSTVALTGACALLCALGLNAPAACAADAGVDALIRQFGVAFNKGDMAAAKAMHVAAPSIVDEVAPHAWNGPKAFDSWVADLTKSETADGVTDDHVTLGAPIREVVSGASAYVVVPATYTFKQKGAAMREAAQMTFALSKQAAGWKIAAWTWTGPDPKPAK